MSGDMDTTTEDSPITRFAWNVSGTAMPSSANTMERPYEHSGTIDAERIGEVVDWLAAGSPVWDGIDQTRPVVIEIIPLDAKLWDAEIDAAARRILALTCAADLDVTR